MPQPPKRPPTVLTGCAGEHFVAYRLSVMNYLAALTRGGSPSVDVFAGTVNGQKTVTIQVKTARNAFCPSTRRKPDSAYWEWTLSAKAKDLCGESVFYAFVDLRERDGDPAKSMPDVFIVPAKDVKEHVQTFNKRPGGSPFYCFDIPEKDKDKWYEAWHLIRERLGDGHLPQEPRSPMINIDENIADADWPKRTDDTKNFQVPTTSKTSKTDEKQPNKSKPGKGKLRDKL